MDSRRDVPLRVKAEQILGKSERMRRSPCLSPTTEVKQKNTSRWRANAVTSHTNITQSMEHKKNALEDSNIESAVQQDTALRVGTDKIATNVSSASPRVKPTQQQTDAAPPSLENNLGNKYEHQM